MLRRLPWVLAAVVLVGCGKEVGKVAMTAPGSGDASVSLSSGQELALWTALDAEWNGSFAPSYAVELRDASGKTVASTTCNPMNPSVKTSSVETTLGAHHMRRYHGKMRCGLTAPSAGTFTVHATLTFGAPPPGLAVKDMSLILKT